MWQFSRVGSRILKARFWQCSNLLHLVSPSLCDFVFSVLECQETFLPVVYIVGPTWLKTIFSDHSQLDFDDLSSFRVKEREVKLVTCFLVWVWGKITHSDRAQGRTWEYLHVILCPASRGIAFWLLETDAVSLLRPCLLRCLPKLN